MCLMNRLRAGETIDNRTTRNRTATFNAYQRGKSSSSETGAYLNGSAVGRVTMNCVFTTSR